MPDYIQLIVSGSATTISDWVVLTILFAFAAGYAAHYFRHRHDHSAEDVARDVDIAGRPRKPATSKIDNIPIISYDKTQRAIHWLLTAVLAFLTLTGFEVYFNPTVAGNVLTVFSLIYHSDVSAVLLILIIAHVIHDMRKAGSSQQMKPNRLYDLTTLKVRVRNFFSPNGHEKGAVALGRGGAPDNLREGKYDIFMKGYHWMLTAALVVLGVTGFYFWDPYNTVSAFFSLPVGIQVLFLDLHILAAVVTVGLIAGHVYFALLPVNRPILSSLLSGRLEEDYYLQHYDLMRWSANIVKISSRAFARLPNSLSDANFSKLTGYKDRQILRMQKEIMVPFAVIQKTCGKYSTHTGRCSAKDGAPCSSVSCPVLGTYVSPRALAQRRKVLKQMAAGAAVVGFLALGIGYAYKTLSTVNGLNGQRTTQTQGQTTTTQVAGTPKIIANANSMPNNSSTYFTDPQGNPNLLVKLANGSLDAYSAICTHAGCQVGYDTGYEIIYCPCHGALFNPSNGSVERGPAFYPLPRVQIRVDSSTGDVYIG